MRLTRASSGRQGRSGEPSNSMCTAWGVGEKGRTGGNSRAVRSLRNQNKGALEQHVHCLWCEHGEEKGGRAATGREGWIGGKAGSGEHAIETREASNKLLQNCVPVITAQHVPAQESRAAALLKTQAHKDTAEV